MTSSGDKEQLTVAELLARAGNSSAPAGRSRRHRSLEEGGVSVAELTGSLKRVKEKPEESRHSSVPIDAAEPDEDATAAQPAQDAQTHSSSSRFTAPAKATPAAAEAAGPEAHPQDNQAHDTDSTAVMRAVPEDAGRPVVDEAASAENMEHTGPIQQVHPDATQAAPAQPAQQQGFQPAQAQPPASQQEQSPVNPEQEESSPGIGSTIIYAATGVLIGVIVFLGFQYLWDSSISSIIVGVLALVVTGVAVGLVHALRTTRDGLSMALAGVVGLAMTFGPLIPGLF